MCDPQKIPGSQHIERVRNKNKDENKYKGRVELVVYDNYKCIKGTFLCDLTPFFLQAELT